MTLALATTTALTATVGELAPAIKCLASTLPKSGSHSIDDTGIVFTATDGYTTVATHSTTAAVELAINADTISPGVFAVNGHDLNRAITKLVGRRSRTADQRTLSFDADEHAVTIHYDEITVTLPTIKAPDTPASAHRIPLGVIDADDLRSIWARTSVACGTDDTLPMLTVINMRIQDNSAIFVATDRFRLARAITPFQPGNDATAPTSVSFPAAMFQQMATLLADVTGPVTLETTPPQENGKAHIPPRIYVTAPGLSINSLLFDGQFPNIDPLLPKTATVVVTANAAALKDRLTKIQPHAGRHGLLRLDITDEEMTMQVGDEDGHAKTTISVDAMNVETDGPYTCSFNIDYAIEGLKSLGAIDKVTFLMTLPSRPGLFFDAAGGHVTTPTVDEPAPVPAVDTLYLLMPVRLPG